MHCIKTFTSCCILLIASHALFNLHNKPSIWFCNLQTRPSSVEIWEIFHINLNAYVKKIHAIKTQKYIFTYYINNLTINFCSLLQSFNDSYSRTSCTNVFLKLISEKKIYVMSVLRCTIASITLNVRFIRFWLPSSRRKCLFWICFCKYRTNFEIAWSSSGSINSVFGKSLESSKL